MDKAKEWNRGYYCAVAVMLKYEGSVTSIIRELFESGGNVWYADEEDKAVFKEHGLSTFGARPARSMSGD
jgi:hypothetical protein